jgi:hypothetical protein
MKAQTFMKSTEFSELKAKIISLESDFVSLIDELYGEKKSIRYSISILKALIQTATDLIANFEAVENMPEPGEEVEE